MKTIAVIGGHRKEAFEKMAKAYGKFQIIFHDAKLKKKNGKKVLESLVKKADCIIVVKDACSHQSMWDTREISKQYNIPIFYHKGLGVTGALNQAMMVLQNGTPAGISI